MADLKKLGCVAPKSDAEHQAQEQPSVFELAKQFDVFDRPWELEQGVTECGLYLPQWNRSLTDDTGQV